VAFVLLLSVYLQQEGKTMECCDLRQDLRMAVAVVALLGATISTAVAAPIKVEAVLTPKEQIRLDFGDGSKHFVLMIKREGKATGADPLAGTVVTEYGRHDIVPGVGGDPSGYLVFSAADGDIAYVKWLVRAVFVPGPDGKPMLLDNGVWEVVGGTGKFKGLQGAGVLHIKPVSSADRNFILEGVLVPAREGAKK
jgi:hypothetical protein